MEYEHSLPKMHFISAQIHYSTNYSAGLSVFYRLYNNNGLTMTRKQPQQPTKQSILKEKIPA